MMSDGISSLTISPSSSDLASQRSQGKMTVSDPYREDSLRVSVRAGPFSEQRHLKRTTPPADQGLHLSFAEFYSVAKTTANIFLSR